MRCAVLGDIHGNFHALEAVLDAIKDEGVDSIVCVGDVVGYAANPAECIQAVKEHVQCSVAGNHDFGAVGKMNLDYFNPDARNAVEWAGQQLTQEDRDYLAALPLTQELDEFELVHSSPNTPEEFLYVQSLYDATEAFRKMQGNLAFVGHSHVPVVFVSCEPPDFFLLAEFELPADMKVIVNVGSVGQPRDDNPLAGYALFDSDGRTVAIRRVEYDVETAKQKILDAGLPEVLAVRLVLGR